MGQAVCGPTVFEIFFLHLHPFSLHLHRQPRGSHIAGYSNSDRSCKAEAPEVPTRPTRHSTAGGGGPTSHTMPQSSTGSPPRRDTVWLTPIDPPMAAFLPSPPDQLLSWATVSKETHPIPPAIWSQRPSLPTRSLDMSQYRCIGAKVSFHPRNKPSPINFFFSITLE